MCNLAQNAMLNSFGHLKGQRKMGQSKCVEGACGIMHLACVVRWGFFVFVFSLLVQHLHTNLTNQNRNKNIGSHTDLWLNVEIVMSHIKSQQKPQFRYSSGFVLHLYLVLLFNYIELPSMYWNDRLEHNYFSRGSELLKVIIHVSQMLNFSLSVF